MLFMGVARRAGDALGVVHTCLSARGIRRPLRLPDIGTGIVYALLLVTLPVSVDDHSRHHSKNGVSINS